MYINKRDLFLAMSMLISCMQSLPFDVSVYDADYDSCKALGEVQDVLMSDEQRQQSYELWWFHGGGKKAFADACDGDSGYRGGLNACLYSEDTKKTIVIKNLHVVSGGWGFTEAESFPRQGVAGNHHAEMILVPTRYLEWLGHIQNQEYRQAHTNYTTRLATIDLTPQEKFMQPMLSTCRPACDLFEDLNTAMLMCDINEPVQEVKLQDVWHMLQLAQFYKSTVCWQQAIIDRFESASKQPEKLVFIERFGEGPNRAAMSRWADKVFNTASTDG